MPRYRKRRRTSRRRNYSRVRGRGGYWSELAGDVIEGTGGALGTIAGATYGPVGAVAGGYGGSVAGRGLARAAGLGAYNVSSNSLVAVHEGNPVPEFGSASNVTHIRHRDFICDVSNAGTTDFTLTSYILNPGNTTTFPFLSRLAQNFQTYSLQGMIIEFVSTSSDITSGGALGSVVMATDYDANADAPSSKSEMENMQFSISAKPSVNQTHIIECDPALQQNEILNVARSGFTPSTVQDQNSYNWGQFHFATVGVPSSSGNIGELWVTYDVALLKPKPSYGLQALSDMFKLTAPAAAGPAYFGTAQVSDPSNTLGGTIFQDQYFFPTNVDSGTFLITYVMTGASTTLTTALALTLVNCDSNVSSFFPASQYARVTAGAVATMQTCSWWTTVTAADASFSITAGTLCGTPTGGSLLVQRCTHFTEY